MEKVISLQKDRTTPVKRGKAVIRCTGKHADLIEQRVKTFSIRWDEAAGPPGDLQSGKYLTIIRYDGRFQNQRRITNDDVLITGVAPIHLTPEGITLTRTGRSLTQQELAHMAVQDGFNNYSEMAFYYLTRRTAYHDCGKKPRKEFFGFLLTWKWVPHLRNIKFVTKNRPSERKPRLEKWQFAAQQRELRNSGIDIFAKPE